jgi:uncharacterized Fe-S cluster-containing protein
MKKNTINLNKLLKQLPGYNCGSCGYGSCAGLAQVSLEHPEYIQKCVNLKKTITEAKKTNENTCGNCTLLPDEQKNDWKDFLNRDFDFILQTFPNEPGPRETILPHNPSLTRELKIKKGDVLIGRPMGMSCGCPITHCGITMDVDQKTGVIVWCVTGPIQPRLKGFKDLGYYSAQAYEGLIRESRKELKVGMRYWFLPRRCMLQWRHSGLMNFITKRNNEYQVRIEGLMIG